MTTWTTKYDTLFRLAKTRFFVGVRIDGKAFDWRWLKAQAIAESALKYRAVSHCGAMGLMQLMPKTAKECAKQLGIPNEPYDPKCNVMMGGHYLRRCWDIFGREVGMERLRFAWAAYNAGSGNIIKAQKKAAGMGLPTNKWTSIVAALPKVTGKHATETISYVSRIERLYKQLVNEGAEA